MNRKPRRQGGTKRSRSNHSSLGEIRIIGGDWRGRKLPVRQAEGLRPTSDRVRETLFNWLQFEIPGARCLDVFAGSGALGLEALSRGAAQVTLLEKDSQNAQLLIENVERLQADNAEVMCVDSLSWLNTQAKQAYDVVFLDPPFHKGLLEDVLKKVVENGYLNLERGWLYLEQEVTKDWPDLGEGWSIHREKTTSQVKYALFKPDGK